MSRTQKSCLDSKFYEDIGDATKRMAIIVTDYTENDKNYTRMGKDVDNIKNMLRNLGFIEKNIKELKKSIARNSIHKQTTDYCTLEGDHPHHGYIMMFNLTYKDEANNFRGGSTFYNSEQLRCIFVVNNLKEWAIKPKLIFYQTPLIQSNESKQLVSVDQVDSLMVQQIDLPIDVDIYESFSNDGEEDSYGDENGSFYIQALCTVINQHIDKGTINNTSISQIMYKVHTRINEMVGEMGSQTPFTKSTLVKKFVFPV